MGVDFGLFRAGGRGPLLGTMATSLEGPTPINVVSEEKSEIVVVATESFRPGPAPIPAAATLFGRRISKPRGLSRSKSTLPLLT